MKLIIAIIQPDKLGEVKKELYKSDVNLITVTEVLGHGRQMGISEVYRGVKENGNLLRKVQLEIAVNDNYVQPTVDAIVKGARTGEVGDGKIFILELKDCVRISTGETGGKAIARQGLADGILLYCPSYPIFKGWKRCHQGPEPGKPIFSL